MNKNIVMHYMKTEPEGTKQKYLFIVNDPDIALSIITSGFRVMLLSKEPDEFYFTADTFWNYMQEIFLKGTYQSDHCYVPACTEKWMNDRIEELCKDLRLEYRPGWKLFKDKEYLGKLDNQPELVKHLDDFILRFERKPKEEPELGRFHKFDDKGKVKGILDLEIVNFLLETVDFFILGKIPFYYKNGVYREDLGGVVLKHHIQKLIYPDQVQSNIIQRVYNLLITQPKVHRELYELNCQPPHWVNFKNGYYDPIKKEMVEHDPKYLTTNQIPFPFYPEDKEQVLAGGKSIRKYLDFSVPNLEEQQMFWEYFGYCMTTDTQFQKFLMLRGAGGTGKSVAISLLQYIVSEENTTSISLQDLNKRFYATGLFGKLLNACADIPCTAMETTDVLKKAVGEDTLIYEKKGQDAIQFRSYAKLLFSANSMPQNLEDKSNALYRRLLVLEMDRKIPTEEKDLNLKNAIKDEADYAIHKAMQALSELYERGEFTESEHSRTIVLEIQKASDSVCAFLDDTIVRVKGKRLKRSEVFKMYEDYCSEYGRQGHGKAIFFRNMTEKGFQVKQYNGEYCYQDIAIKEEEFHSLKDGEQTPFDQNIKSEQLRLNIES